ncbi:heavy metal sensor histidine kinase [Caballeronia sp. LZ034LL]|uniref:heavy metal sensor histidine kinase n=1 Tax=Caballeronia sp. LZ034LL TaxID=3038567 RepID=UPI002855CB01|nr:heavy metal sensor histidine kinase [Caballeronia sp. LZ034LL]MDR5837429.1 heavy metal sensor histidine kinase [Caballeronia sp. LZ034LL]
MTCFLPRTLRARLTVLIVLSTSLVLASTGVLVYETLKGRLEATSSAEMTGTLQEVRAHLAEAVPDGTPEAGIAAVTETLHGRANVDLAILAVDGRLLISTPGFRRGADDAKPDNPTVRYRYLTAMVPLGSSPRSVEVVVRYDRTSDIALLGAQARTIVLIQALGVLLAAALAYGITMLGISPLRRMVEHAEAISVNRLAQPLPALGAAGELAELERAFNAMLRRLNESFTLLSQFSSDLAHDMRTPLTNLQAAAQVVLSQQRTANEYREVIESSLEEYRRLTTMVEDMLFLARSEQAGALLAVRALDAAAEAERVAGYYESMAEEACVSIEVCGAAAVDADLLLYQRALSNLLSNALSHAPQGSVVRIDCETCVLEGADMTKVSVSDTGAGIAQPHLDRIFDRFYRVDPARSNSAAGTGLGLAIVKSIMERHGGACGVRSVPHVATTFWMAFPRRPHPALQSDAAGTSD